MKGVPSKRYLKYVAERKRGNRPKPLTPRQLQDRRAAERRALYALEAYVDLP